MRSHATIAALVGAVLLWAATAAAQVTPTTERVMKGTLTDSTVPSTNVPGPVAITYYLPQDYDAKRAEPYPLLIQLHGGGASNHAMDSLSSPLASAWARCWTRQSRRAWCRRWYR